MSDFQAPQKNERTYNTRPPIPDELLVTLYRRWRVKNRSEYIPLDYLQAARWWINHQEPATAEEMPVAGTDSKGNQYWITPHISRLVASFRAFLEMSESEKVFIVGGIEAGVPYRGDDIKFYKRVVQENKVMNVEFTAGRREQYIDGVFKKMESALRGMQV